MNAARLEVVAAGPLATVQDFGRHGLAAWGVAPSGAADPASLLAANRLVGNPPGAAAVEATFGGLVLRPTADVVLAVTGARCRDAPYAEPVAVPAGREFRLGPATAGLRAYVAVAGGVDVAPVMGSRATDLLAGLGPPPLRPGDLLPVGSAAPGGGAGVRADVPPLPADVPPLPADVPPLPADGPLRLRLWPGPDADEPLLRALTAGVRRVSTASNRTAVLLEGEPLRPRTGDRQPIGLLPGAVQLPADGQPRVFLADHPLTGGYPLVGVVDPADVRLLAQTRPGAAVVLVTA